MTSLCLPAALLASLAVPAIAAEPYVGEWAQSPNACKVESLFYIGSGKFNGSTYSCEDVAFAKEGKGWRAMRMQCIGIDIVKPFDQVAKLTVDGGKLQVFRADGRRARIW